MSCILKVLIVLFTSRLKDNFDKSRTGVIAVVSGGLTLFGTDGFVFKDNRGMSGSLIGTGFRTGATSVLIRKIGLNEKDCKESPFYKIFILTKEVDWVWWLLFEHLWYSRRKVSIVQIDCFWFSKFDRSSFVMFNFFIHSFHSLIEKRFSRIIQKERTNESRRRSLDLQSNQWCNRVKC